MKIGFFGNANNAPFSIAQEMRELGYEVLFIVDREQKLDRPENKYSKFRPPYPCWIVDLSPLDLWHYPPDTKKREEAVRMLRECDAVVLNQFGLALSPFVQRPGIALLTGTDLQIADYAYEKFLYSMLRGNTLRTFLRALKWGRTYRRFWRELIEAQRAGIRSACEIIHFPKGMLPAHDSILDGISTKHPRSILNLIVETNRISYHPLPRSSRAKVFNVARISWIERNCEISESPLDIKRTDILIRGVGMYRRRGGCRFDLYLVRKGTNIPETEWLIVEEGIQDWVVWLSELSQEGIIQMYRDSHIVVDQLNAQGAIGLGALEAMAVGRPVIAHGRPEFIEPIVGTPSPLCQAATPEEVCGHLERLIPNPDLMETIGRQSRDYVERNVSTQIMAKKIDGILKKSQK